MKRPGALIVLAAGALALIPAVTGAGLDPTRVRYDTDYLPAGGYACPAIPQIMGRMGEILGTIDNPQRRSELAEQWLQYSKQVIAKDQEYRQQWLDFQRQQSARQQQVEELRLEVARLQMQMEELRARNARLERENLLSQSRFEQTSGDRTTAPQSPASHGSARQRPGQALWSSISALLFGAKPSAGRDKDVSQ